MAIAHSTTPREAAGRCVSAGGWRRWPPSWSSSLWPRAWLRRTSGTATTPTCRRTSSRTSPGWPGSPIPTSSIPGAWPRARTTPLWISDNGMDVSTLYTGGIHGSIPVIVPLVVDIPGGAPTGIVFNPTTDFVVQGASGSAPANFIFASEAGQITAWSKAVSGTQAATEFTSPTAVYKGLAMASTLTGPSSTRRTSTTARSTSSTRPSRRRRCREASPIPTCRPASRPSASRTWTASCT